MTSKDDRRRAEIEKRLRAAGDEHRAARDSLTTARANLDPLIVEALKLDIPPGKVQEWSSLSHQTVRTIARIAGIPAPPGYNR